MLLYNIPHYKTPAPTWSNIYLGLYKGDQLAYRDLSGSCTCHSNGVPLFPSSANFSSTWQCFGCDLSANGEYFWIWIFQCLFFREHSGSYSRTRVRVMQAHQVKCWCVFRRNYVNSATARKQNLTFASNGHFVVRADFKKVLSPSGPGRNSVRLQSYNQYTTGVTM
jgi:hypothetical protein